MTHVWRRSIAPLLVLGVGLLLASPTEAGAFQLFQTEEATIADIQAALKARTLTCRALVQMYLDRIEAFDKKGPALNAIVAINADALKTADSLDVKYAQTGPTGPDCANLASSASATFSAPGFVTTIAFSAGPFLS